MKLYEITTTLRWIKLEIKYIPLYV